MFKNLDGFKKIKEDKNSTTMMHPKGHTITIAMKPLSAMHKGQLKALPLHKCEGGEIKMAKGGSIKMADGGTPLVDYGQNSTPVQPYTDPSPYTGGIQDAVLDALPSSPNIDTTSQYDPNAEAHDESGIGASPVPASVLPKAQPKSDFQSSSSIPDQQQNSQISQPAVSSQPDYSNAANAVAMGLKGIDQAKTAEIKESQAKLPIEQSDIEAKQDLNTGLQMNYDHFQQQQQAFQDYVKNNPINPAHYQENQSATAKVATAIGLALGGFSNGLTGHGNPAMDFLNKQIDRDIQGQQDRFGQQKTLLEANHQMYQDGVVASNATRMNLNDIYAHKIQQAADQLGTPMAQARANMLKSQLLLQNNGLMQQNALRATVLNSIKNGGQGLDAIDLAHIGYATPEQAEKEQASINAQKTSIAQVNDIYNQLAKEQSGLNLINPQARARVDSLKAQLTNAVVGASASKRLTPESAKLEIEPILSSGWHDQKTRDTQKSAILNMIQHHADPTPIMQKYAQKSLPQYQSMTSGRSQTTQPPSAGDIIYVKGQKAQILDNKGNYKLVQ